MPLNPSQLTLSDGTEYHGLSPAWQSKVSSGEVVFTTGMTGYVETLTDPSYAGQIITFTYPLIGNYGVPDPTTWESKKIHARGVIMSETCFAHSHHTAKQSLLEWLKKENVTVILGVDTRALTKKLRESGVMLGTISHRILPLPSARLRADSGGGLEARPQAVLRGGRGVSRDIVNEENLVAQVTIAKKKIYQPKTAGRRFRVIAVDCGMKENIIRELQKFPYEIHRVPYNYDYTKEPFDGVFLSNGPGDPTRYTETIEILRKVMSAKGGSVSGGKKPIFGICLGSQLMALAAGAKTYKLPYGHRGHNQPCLFEGTDKAYLTSQNHGYAVDEKTLPKGWRVSFRNLNDNSVEGVEHVSLPFFSVQFHPEAAPGPTDTEWLFEKFYKLLQVRSDSRLAGVSQAEAVAKHTS